VLEQLPPLVDGVLVSEVEMRNDKTFYTLMGNLWIYFSMMALLWVAVDDLWMRHRKKS
jgi:apolipoprotein N-acyltransferase